MLQKTLVIFLAVFSCTLNISALPLFKKTLRGVKPKQRSISSIITVKEGEAITLPCTANGSYTPVFHWLFNNEYIEQSPLDTIARNLISPKHSHFNAIVVATMHIEHATQKHAGKYTCIADSLTKRVTRTITLKVEAKSSSKPNSEVEVVKQELPVIYQWTKTIAQDLGTTLYVVCRATQGKTAPVPQIRWTLTDIFGTEEETVITENEDITIHSNGDLEVRNLGKEFNWRNNSLGCKAISKDGHYVAEKTTFVYVLENEEEES